MNLKTKLAFIPAFTALALSSCTKQAPPPPPVRSFPVVTAKEMDVTGVTSFPTSIQGINNNEVRAKIQGYIKEVYVDEGQHVKAGQPLFRLETNTLSQNASAARSGVTAAQSNISAAQAAVDAARIEVSKLEPLVAKNIISAVQLETAKANLLRAQSQLEQAKAGFHQAQANYKSASATVDYSLIRAPVSGVVGKINMRAGSLVGPTDPAPITVVSDTRKLYAYFSMNESEYLDFLESVPGKSVSEKLRNMPMVELLLANGSIYGEKGKVETVTGQIDQSTGTVQFRAGFENKDGLLTNGNSGQIRIPKKYSNALVIPEASTFEQQGNIYTFRVEKDTARSVILTLTDRIDNVVIIKDGIKKGDQVIAAPASNLKSGTAIKPVPADMDSLVKKIRPIF